MPRARGEDLLVVLRPLPTTARDELLDAMEDDLAWSWVPDEVVACPPMHHRHALETPQQAVLSAELRVTNDASGRVRQMIDVCPGVLVLAVGLRAAGRTARH